MLPSLSSICCKHLTSASACLEKESRASDPDGADGEGKQCWTHFAPSCRWTRQFVIQMYFLKVSSPTCSTEVSAQWMDPFSAQLDPRRFILDQGVTRPLTSANLAFLVYEQIRRWKQWLIHWSNRNSRSMQSVSRCSVESEREELVCIADHLGGRKEKVNSYRRMWFLWSTIHVKATRLSIHVLR